jgi:hypothetical protein
MDLPEDERKEAAEKVVGIAEKYLARSEAFPTESRSRKALFTFCCYVLLAAQTALHGLESGEEIVAALDRTLRRFGRGSARMTAE